jgi:cyclic-di-GMP-binding protein
MPSFDIVSKADPQTLDNALNVAQKEITTRYDFKGTHVLIELDKKNNQLKLEAESDMKMEQMIDVIVSRGMRQGLDANVFDLSKEHYPSGKIIRKEVAIRNGLARDDAKKIVEVIKKSGLKVQPAIMDDIIRVTGKKIDDLQDVIQLCREANLGIPLQYVNMKS